MICVDSNILIRLLEGQVDDRALIQQRLRNAGPLCASALAWLECRVKPMRDGDSALLGRYERLLAAENLTLVPIDKACLVVATQVRAAFGFKALDALHLAAAVVAGCETFMTGDRLLARCDLVKVEIV